MEHMCIPDEGLLRLLLQVLQEAVQDGVLGESEGVQSPPDGDQPQHVDHVLEEVGSPQPPCKHHKNSCSCTDSPHKHVRKTLLLLLQGEKKWTSVSRE